MSFYYAIIFITLCGNIIIANSCNARPSIAQSEDSARKYSHTRAHMQAQSNKLFPGHEIVP